MKLPMILLVLLVVSLASCATVPPGDRARVAALSEAVDRNRPFEESAFVVSQGLNIHYRHWKPSGEAVGQILLVHGFGASTFSFRYVVPALLAAGWEVAAADIPPFGFSDHDPAALKKGADRGELLWPVIDQLGWLKPVLLGHSMGGLYVSLMAQAHPERTRALVLLAGAVSVDGKPAGGAPFFAGLLTPFIDNTLRSWASVKDLLQGFAVKGEVIPDEMVDGYTVAFQGPREAEALIAWATSPSAGILDPKRLNMPVFALWGESDTIVPLETGAKFQLAVDGTLLTVMPRVGHLAHELNPEVVTPHLVEFLSRLN